MPTNFKRNSKSLSRQLRRNQILVSSYFIFTIPSKRASIPLECTPNLATFKQLCMWATGDSFCPKPKIYDPVNDRIDLREIANIFLT